MNTKIPDIRPNYYEANFDAEKIAPYTLEDPLTFLDGSKVRNSEDWQKRRKEILDIFASEMFGAVPPAPEAVTFDLLSEKTDALAGFAVVSEYKVYFTKDKSGPAVNFLVIRPRHAKKAAPPIIFLNYNGNHQLIPDTQITIPDMWAGLIEGYKVPAERGVMNNPDKDNVIPIGMLLSAGYSVITACYCQVSPDPYENEKDEFSQKKFAYTGVFDLWGERDENRSDNTTAIGAWAWALSRALDLAYMIPELDAQRAIVTGFSRLGKAALLAAARDERFPVCVPIQCGGGGATLAKRDFGENIATETKMFTHWYCKAYEKYARNPAQLLTFDQHLLLAAVAPRKLLIGGFDAPWFDTEGEYLACKAAGCAWKVCGKAGFPDVPYPADFETSAIGEYLGYYRRSEGHGIADFDWYQILNFVKDAGVY